VRRRRQHDIDIDADVDSESDDLGGRHAIVFAGSNRFR
jgi:hypothetical protein